jgi:hypothetical protein
MAAADAAGRAVPYLERLLENEYVQDQLSEAFGSLRSAYGRASGRKPAEVAEDKKLRRQVRDAVASLREAAGALKTGREKPKKRRRGRVVLLVGVSAAAALATSESLRGRIRAALGSGGAGDQSAGDTATT